ncbi:MAG TPA: mechanosensitive ion channel domain-containing protein, partial [Acholeplasma sp.]|nr:mechanosensitive ion channel domain-containing protein [Acholeplasma sp.]
LIPALFLIQMIDYLPTLKSFLDVILILNIAYLFLKIISSALDLVNKLYVEYNDQSSLKPIKGVLTFIKIILFMVVVIIVVAHLVGESPVVILTGLGALSAVIMLIFKDSILGLVAGFQMSANDLIRIGDWIEMPEYGVDGDVIDVTLTFVRIQNWDKTTVTIPAYKLISESFVNWRSVFDTGGRRIKRSISIDSKSVKIVNDELYEKLLKVDYIKEYLISKKLEIERYNKEGEIDTSVDLNGRRLTNLGVFRIYLTECLKRNPNIHQDLFMLVRQLQNKNMGIPLEVYAFSNKTSWADYENTISDIFDHIYATTDYFELRIFQEPSGYDILQKIKSK